MAALQQMQRIHLEMVGVGCAKLVGGLENQSIELCYSIPVQIIHFMSIV